MTLTINLIFEFYFEIVFNKIIDVFILKTRLIIIKFFVNVIIIRFFIFFKNLIFVLKKFEIDNLVFDIKSINLINRILLMLFIEKSFVFYLLIEIVFIMKILLTRRSIRRI